MLPSMMLLLGLVHGVLEPRDLAELRVRLGDSDAVDLQVEGLGAGQRLAAVDRLGQRVDRAADVLEGGGEDVAACTRPGRACLYWSESTPIAQTFALAAASITPCAGEAGRRVDDVGLLLDLALGGGLALVGAGEAALLGGLRQVLRQDLDLRVGVLDALLVAGLELVDQRDVHAADEADGVRSWWPWRRRHRRGTRPAPRRRRGRRRSCPRPRSRRCRRWSPGTSAATAFIARAVGVPDADDRVVARLASEARRCSLSASVSPSVGSMSAVL